MYFDIYDQCKPYYVQCTMYKYNVPVFRYASSTYTVLRYAGLRYYQVYDITEVSTPYVCCISVYWRVNVKFFTVQSVHSVSLTKGSPKPILPYGSFIRPLDRRFSSAQALCCWGGKRLSYFLSAVRRKPKQQEWTAGLGIQVGNPQIRIWLKAFRVGACVDRVGGCGERTRES